MALAGSLGRWFAVSIGGLKETITQGEIEGKILFLMGFRAKKRKVSPDLPKYDASPFLRDKRIVMYRSELFCRDEHHSSFCIGSLDSAPAHPSQNSRPRAVEHRSRLAGLD